jgi:amidase
MKQLDWLVEVDILKLQAEMESGRMASVDIVSGYLERIRKYDPLIHSILELNPDAIEIAEALDQERKNKG